MKAALNGALNLSILDGWWDEWYDGNNGWAIPSADGVDNADRRDDLEAAALYDLIEKDVAPRFYDLDDSGLPFRWIEMVRHTLRSLGPKVLARRMVVDYVEDLYAPAATSSRALNGDFDGARELAAWKQRVRRDWPSVRVEHVESGGVDELVEVGETMSVRAFVALGALTPEDIDVQVVHGRIQDEDDLVDPQVMSLSLAESYEGGRHRFDGDVPLVTTGAFGYTVRILPRNPHLTAASALGLVAAAVG
jgi:starch phosphorylase